MNFHSLEFAIFLPIVFSLYWLITPRRRRTQNLLLLGASYVFYGWWDWRFLSLIVISSAVDYLTGILLSKSERPGTRTRLLLLSLFVNLGILGFFKYWNFFAESFTQAFSLLGVHAHPQTLRLILPVGISFYTFQTLSYTIDVFRRKIEPTRDIVAFFAFVAFFPQLVAGPIERARNLLPQFKQQRSFDYEVARDGLRQIVWGLFKKVVVADTCAVYVDEVFPNYAAHSSLALVLATFYFAIQIYCDFSGYSDIAIGTAKLFGFRLMQNFRYPYFARDIAEFWRRWHISLSTWFRDYLYIPLGGNRAGRLKTIRNILVTFLVSGFWHGANLTFLAWGALHALYYLPLALTQRHRRHMGVTAEDRTFPAVGEFLKMALTFLLTTFAWVFFRAESLSHAFSFIGRILSFQFTPIDGSAFNCLPLVALLLAWDWLQRDRQHGLEIDGFPVPLRWGFYAALCWSVLALSKGGQAFIYFQF
ncbi:MAG: MBOAT family protein [bacterium]|nr:MBOAT family protein [bacterium]